MTRNLTSSRMSYLPLKKFHIVPINALDPASIKKSAKRRKRDREKIKYNTLLNTIVNSLGITGGFANYQRVYDCELLPFLRKHRMVTHVDLLKPRKKGSDNFLPDITHQDLSERLFSGWTLPKQVFTGYDYNYEDTLDEGYSYFSQCLCLDGTGPMGLKDISFMNKDAIENNISIAKQNPNKLFHDYNNPKFANRKLIDLVIGGFMRELTPVFHLLGDSLVKPALKVSEVKEHSTNSGLGKLNQHKETYLSMFKLFRERIEESDEGWVEIVPFNSSLIFLKGKDGEYDFVFKNQRESVFEHQIFGENLKRADIPSCISDYNFLRWHYFEYQGWRDLDSYESENLFYKNGGTAVDYPGESVILQRYHEEKGNFLLPKTFKSSQRLPSFYEVEVKGRNLMVSNLISIDDFSEFKHFRNDYFAYRVGDNLDSVNNESDQTLPVTLTWYDALCYINWFEDKTKIPVRLLDLSEYQLIRSKMPKPEDVPLLLRPLTKQEIRQLPKPPMFKTKLVDDHPMLVDRQVSVS